MVMQRPASNRIRTKLVTVLTVLIFAAPAIQPAAAQEGPPMGSTCSDHQENLDLYLKVHKHIFNERDVNRAEEFFAPDFVNHNGPDWAPQGPAAIRQYLPMLAKSFSDRAVKLDFVLCDGDYVVAHTFVEATNDGPFMGRPPTGKFTRVTGTDIYRIRDGKIAARWGNEDSLGLWQQLGLIPEPDYGQRGPSHSKE